LVNNWLELITVESYVALRSARKHSSAFEPKHIQFLSQPRIGVSAPIPSSYRNRFDSRIATGKKPSCRWLEEASIKLNQFEAQIEEAWPTANWRNGHVLLAVSGGADSVALLRAVSTLKKQAGGRGRVIAGHFNHGWRGVEANADQAWVEQLGARLDIEVGVGHALSSPPPPIEGDRSEATARDLRYRFLTQTAEQFGARFVVTAHTWDDQVETILHRIVRGTGIAGLSGMPKHRPLSPSVTLIRPLLNVRRREVLEYLTSLGQDFRTDSSNAESCFTRNRIRHELLPALRREYNGHVDEALLRLASQACEMQQWLGNQVAQLVDLCLASADAAQIHIDCKSLAGQPPLVVREVCKFAWTRAGWPQQAMGHSEWQKLANLVLADGGIPAVSLPGDVQVRRESATLILSRRAEIS